MQTTALEMEQQGRKLTESAGVRLLKNMLHPVLMKAARSSVTFRIVKDNTCRPLAGRPILYAANHYCGQDIIIACSSVKERLMVVAGVQGLTPIDELFFHVNGTIFVDRKNREDMAASKRSMVEHLRSGQNVLIFPEGTSNVSDELLMYPMKWGVIEAARESGAQIIPIVLHYNKETMECHVHYGDPMIVDDMSREEGIVVLRDTMASVRYEYFAAEKPLVRREANIEELRRSNKELLLSYAKLDYNYEKSVVFHPYPTWEEVFAPVAALRR